MGIPKFTSYIQHNFPKSISNISQTKIGPYSHAYYDINFILHQFVVKRKKPFSKLASVSEYIEKFEKLFGKPSDLAFFGLDGPGPMGKFITQRERRAKTSSEELYSLQITPGTKLMRVVKDILCKYAMERVSNSNNKNFKAIVSGADDPGEGEFKIFQHLSSIFRNVKRNFANKNNNHEIQNKSDQIQSVIVSSDSDVILFALSNSIIQNIDILKYQSDSIIYLVKIPILRESIINSVKTTHNFTFQPNSIIDDFVFITILNGSDYLPGIRHFSPSLAWQSYCTLRKNYHDPLIYKSLSTKPFYKINVPLLKAIHSNLSKVVSEIEKNSDNENQNIESKVGLCNQLFQKIYKGKIPDYEFTEVDNHFHCRLMFEGTCLGEGTGKSKKLAKEVAATIVEPLLTEKVLKIDPNYFTREKIKTHKGIDVQEHELEDQLDKFVKGTIWNMEYLSGVCNDYQFYYPYSSAPSFSEFVNWPKLSSKFFLDDTKNLPMTPLKFSVALLRDPFSRQFLNEPFDKKEFDPLWHASIPELMKEVEKDIREARDENSVLTLFANQFNPTLMFARPQNVQNLKSPHHGATKSVICLSSPVNIRDDSSFVSKASSYHKNNKF